MLLIPILVIMAVVSVSGCAFLTSGSVVVYTGVVFEPRELTVPVGSTVSWKAVSSSLDAPTFTVTSYQVGTGDGAFPSSGDIGPLRSYSYTFETPGTYPYENTRGSGAGVIIVTNTTQNQTNQTNQTNQNPTNPSNMTGNNSGGTTGNASGVSSLFKNWGSSFLKFIGL